MSIPANSSSRTGAVRPTAFRAGQSGNPAGRRPGTRNRVTIEAREAASLLVDDDDYREALRRRMIAGTAGAVEVLMWYYSKGKPIDRVEVAGPGHFAKLTDEELRARLGAAMRSLK